MESLFKEKYAKIEYDQKHNAIFVSWYGFILLDDFKNTMLKALVFFKAKKATHWVIDQTERQAVHPKVNEWVVEELYPKLFEEGSVNSKMAVIVPKDVFGRFSMKSQTESLTTKYKEMIPYQYFQSVNDALKWIV